MDIIRENRWFAPLLGVIMVCIMGVSLVAQAQNKKQESASNEKLVALETSVHAPFTATSTQQERTGSAVSSEMLKKRSLLKTSFTATAFNYPMTKQVVAAPATKAVPQTKSKTAAASHQPKAAVPTVAKADLTIPPKTIFFTRTRLLSPADHAQSTRSYNVSPKELLMLQKIVMAEAEGEPYEGKVAVANVVLNRLRSANFPDTIKDVIYQRAQFSPVANGRFNRVTPNKDSIRAAAEALNGRKEVPDTTYYFLSLTLADDLYVHRHQTLVKQIGHHTFYK
ncbi:cell wall hydrolase [Paenibacillus sp. JX-17]|uniref:Cell wall hydrolase n=1 Tax=Paenibacillus lacisoli TaxID=3064525 RepID=A0ABT9CD39_9BACL|nr:cell wall hydrolase [Paenibacillus sp. JX-17]MDO7907185.1 cell wall hydrolase [Paenibacillus sp. JX-17]